MASRQIRLEIIVDDKGTRQIVNVTREVENLGQKTERAGRQMKHSFAGMKTELTGLGDAMTMLGTFGAGFSVAAFAQVTEDAAKTFRAARVTFQQDSDKVVKAASEMAEHVQHLFSTGDILTAMNRIHDSMSRYGLDMEEQFRLVERAMDVARMKGLGLEESLMRVESAMRGEAEASEYLGLTLNETYMKNIAFDGALKDVWGTLTDSEKAHARYLEFLQQSEKYADQAASATDTLNEAWTKTFNRLRDEHLPILEKLNNLAAFAVKDAADKILVPMEKQMEAYKKIWEWLNGPGKVYFQSAPLYRPSASSVTASPVLVPSDIDQAAAALQNSQLNEELQALINAAKGRKDNKNKSTGKSSFAGITGIYDMMAMAGMSAEDQAYYKVDQRYDQAWQKIEKFAKDTPAKFKAMFGSIDEARQQWASAWNDETEATIERFNKQPTLGQYADIKNIFKMSDMDAEEKSYYHIDERYDEYWQKIQELSKEAPEAFKQMYGSIEEAREEWAAAWNSETDAMIENFQDKSSEMSQSWIQALRNMQDATGNLFVKVLKGQWDDLGNYIVDTITNIAAQWVAAQAQMALFGENFGSGGQIGGWVGAAMQWVGTFFHEGGMVGYTAAPGQMMPAAVWAGAPRLHNGLAPDEFPAILQRGETVIPRRSSGTSTSYSRPEQTIQIVNVFDRAAVKQLALEAVGENPGVVLNIVNRDALSKGSTRYAMNIEV